jgi:hypothetical protein
VVEFVVILPILLSLVGGTLDFARVFYATSRSSQRRGMPRYIADSTYTTHLLRQLESQLPGLHRGRPATATAASTTAQGHGRT